MTGQVRYIFISLCILLHNLLAFDLIEPLPTDFKYDEKKALLGKKLFHDTLLSRDYTISCATCHNISDGGDDNLKYSVGIDAQEGVINSPTVLNSKYNFLQMWDGRAKNLIEQASIPLENPLEMDITMKEVLKRLKKDNFYSLMFKEIYEDGITGANVIDAIVEFESALVTPNSKFDKYLNGDKTALNEEELEGFALFQENGCVSCHNGINIGGNLYQKVGILKRYVGDKNSTGRYNITNKDKDLYYFKVPTLRNIDLTAPYLHDGSRKNLEDIVSFMMIYQVGIIADTDEIKKIVTFLKTLTGDTPKIMELK